MATQDATPGSQWEGSNALDLPSACDIRDYVLQRPSQEASSEAFSSEEALSLPCSSDVDPEPGHQPACNLKPTTDDRPPNNRQKRK
ncbi:shieldin complex subunit 1 isoform X2 [Phacochoerus africanus]|uniref:shieldin complex subunit 1 isoform X2 n=1 Tax=Phacochoerus africanus TaxID=41426 RepID=UPI001FD8C137|nr:shieldin complex subunit 1 isoform X2 [Phacochoerus africanus]